MPVKIGIFLDDGLERPVVWSPSTKRIYVPRFRGLASFDVATDVEKLGNARKRIARLANENACFEAKRA